MYNIHILPSNNNEKRINNNNTILVQEHEIFQFKWKSIPLSVFPLEQVAHRSFVKKISSNRARDMNKLGIPITI